MPRLGLLISESLPSKSPSQTNQYDPWNEQDRRWGRHLSINDLSPKGTNMANCAYSGPTRSVVIKNYLFLAQINACTFLRTAMS